MAETTPKMWFESKTIWLNLIGTIVIFLQTKFGWVIPAEYQVYALTAINFLLRLITKKEVVWDK